MEFAGLLRHGVLHETPILSSGIDENADDEPVEPNHSQNTRPEGSHSIQNRFDFVAEPGGSQYAVPLSKGRIARLDVPRPLTDADHQRLIAWLELMHDVLIEEPGVDS